MCLFLAYSVITQKKYLIESKKLFVWNTFFDVKKCFVSMKQSSFDSKKISLNQINICSNQINVCLKSNKLYLWPYINALISWFWRKTNLIQTNIYLLTEFPHELTHSSRFIRSHDWALTSFCEKGCGTSVAQMTEHSTGNRKDLGSIPSGVEAFLFSQKIS